ncbi:golgin subfamily A member 6-like protein 1 [Lates japonicus]|uniref:Golgin subfamily A member 6-like protein 1 n=1 Tax=Lates japonicus TaxID=270547 RepID=A0AAD3N806_LATJO|nr:golgin subfamily A member 6-like protein 1 [Lates japonicus]
MSNLKTWYLKQQKEKIVKAISKTCDKEVAIDAGDDTLEMKEIRVWRQQAKRKTLLKKQQELEEKIQHRFTCHHKQKSKEVSELIWSFAASRLCGLFTWFAAIPCQTICLLRASSLHCSSRVTSFLCRSLRHQS